MVQMHEKYFLSTSESEKKIALKKKEILDLGEEITEDDEDSFYSMKLDAGLFTLQLVDLVKDKFFF